MSVATFYKICSPKWLFESWDTFRKGKRKRLEVMLYERNLERNIFCLSGNLLSKKYKHGVYEQFKVTDPKLRRISKACVQDRLVHQAVVSGIESSFEKRFIYDSYSCRSGKGTHAAVARLRSFLGKESRNNTRTTYVLKCDVKRFFDCLDHGILMALINRVVKDSDTLWLIEEIVDSFSIFPGKGVPLGNLTSQLFANIYLHELDRFIKNDLGIKYYVRYCDDFVIVDSDSRYLQGLIPILEGFLRNYLNLCLHPNKITLRTWNSGMDFLGYILKPDCTLLRTKTKNRALRRVNSNNLPSYLGICSHCDSFELQQILKCKAGSLAREGS